MSYFHLAFKSLWSRRATTLLTVTAIAVSVSLLLGIERLRDGTKRSFERTVSGVDLIAGARSGSLNLLLYSVFRLGNPTNNVSWQTFEYFQSHKEVKWAVPISLGDSHRGFRVVGTPVTYFDHIKFRGGKSLELQAGKLYESVFEAVVGSEVAEKLNYTVGNKITLSHGASEVSFQDHSDKPFVVVGVLKPTGTPIDRAVHVSLEAIEALHIDWENGAPPMPGQALSADETLKRELQPKQITAFFLGLKSKFGILRVQREINDFKMEPMSALLPGVALTEMWQILSVAEKSLFAVSALVFLSSLITLLISLLTTLNERRREMSIYRSVGASSRFVFLMLVLESLFLSLLGSLFAFVLVYVAMWSFAPYLENKLGLQLEILAPSLRDLYFVIAALLASVFVSLLPAWRAYQNNLHDGLSIKR